MFYDAAVPRRADPWNASQIAIASWGVLGVAGIVAQAVHRLTPLALEPIAEGMLGPGHWALYIGWCLVNAYAEGYRGFQRSFVPRVVARADHLAKNPRPLHVVLAPVFCMAMFHARKKNLILAWALLLGIVAVVALVRLLPQPWRGIVDAGVVVGLGWGLVALLVQFARALLGGTVPATDSLPEALHDAPTADQAILPGS
jgi:hypothetical protein